MFFQISLSPIQFWLGVSTVIILLIVLPPVGFILLIALFLGFLNIHVCLRSESFKINYKLWNFTYSTKEEKNYELIGVFLHCVSKSYQVRLRTTQGTYIIGENLQEEECAWLGQEIQDFIRE